MQIKHKLSSKSKHAWAAPTSAFCETLLGLLYLFFSPFFMSKLWRMQWHAEAKWSGYNGAEMLNGGRGRLRVTGWRRSNKYTPCILLFAPTVISTDGFISLQVVCVSLSRRCVLFGLTLMRLSRGRLLYICSNQWSVQTEFIVSLARLCSLLANPQFNNFYLLKASLQYIYSSFGSNLPYSRMWTWTLFLATHLQSTLNFYFMSRSDELIFGFIHLTLTWTPSPSICPDKPKSNTKNRRSKYCIPQHSMVPHMCWNQR